MKDLEVDKKLTKKNAAWLFDEELQNLLKSLSQNGKEARIVGGAVRNFLLQQKIDDIDIATTNLPDETMQCAKSAGFSVVPTGYAFGTITVIGKKPYEVTSLRQDSVTDGRHAKVVFGEDWHLDAKRRDFTINALYLDMYGNIYDALGGLKDVESQTIRFIGNAKDRIEEDFLRILRFFRFFAIYGKGRPDKEGVIAITQLKNGLTSLSAERVWSELKKILSANDPSRALLWMRQTGVLTTILPETEKWGIDAIHAVVETGHALSLESDPMLRLFCLLPPDEKRLSGMAHRLRFSNVEKKRLLNFARVANIKADSTDIFIQKMLYKDGKQTIIDKLFLLAANARGRAKKEDKALYDAANYIRLFEMAKKFKIPKMPITGIDLLQIGYEDGPVLGKTLKFLEKEWLMSDFQADRTALLAKL